MSTPNPQANAAAAQPDAQPAIYETDIWNPPPMAVGCACSSRAAARTSRLCRARMRHRHPRATAPGWLTGRDGRAGRGPGRP